MTDAPTIRSTRAMSAALWLPGLLVALGAGVATAHGLYEVALGAGVPQPIAWLYPLITDGLALLAYATTVRLHAGARGYAWAVVVLAAGLSGLAQACYLSDDVDSAPAALRFGIGAWPAIAAAITAHLLFLLGTQHPSQPVAHQSSTSLSSTGTGGNTDGRRTSPGVQPSRPATNKSPNGSPRQRARAAAHEHAVRHGNLPTVSELMHLTGVARGTAGNALRELRDQRSQLHVVNDDTEARGSQ